MAKKIKFEAARQATNMLLPSGSPPEVDKGSKDLFSTKGLPEAGDKDDALDNDQQPVGGGAPATSVPGPPAKTPQTVDDVALPKLPQRAASRLMKIAKEVLAQTQDQALARRVAALARQIKAYETDHVTEVADDLYTTGALPLSGDESVDASLPGGNDPPKNEVGNDQSGKIELWGTHPPTADMLASKNTPKSKAKAKKASSDKTYEVIFQYKNKGRWATGLAHVTAPNKTVAQQRFASSPDAKNTKIKAVQLMGKKGPTARKASAAPTSPWASLKQEFSRVASAQQMNGGSYEIKFDQVGTRVAQLTASVTDVEGVVTPLGVVAFTLMNEDPTTRTATLEVNDALIANETVDGVNVPFKANRKYATRWAKDIQEVAEQFLA